jgi:hypothetical protein
MHVLRFKATVRTTGNGVNKNYEEAKSMQLHSYFAKTKTQTPRTWKLEAIYREQQRQKPSASLHPVCLSTNPSASPAHPSITQKELRNETKMCKIRPGRSSPHPQYQSITPASPRRIFMKFVVVFADLTVT